MSSSADRALAQQERYLTWSRSTTGWAYCEAVASEAGLVVDDGPRIVSDSLLGETYVVSPDIVALLAEASLTIPPFPLRADDLPSIHGYVNFDNTAVVQHDSYERPIVVTGMGWSGRTSADGSGVLILLWTDPMDERDSMYQDFTSPEALAAQGFSVDELRQVAPALPLLAGFFVFGATPPENNEAARILWAFLRFIQEPWIDNREEQPSRAARRRAERAKLPVKVRTVHLRAAAPKDGESQGEGGRDYSHRWLVRGHWRNQWYPSQGRHAPRFIAPYVKGPEDKPLHVKDTVYLVER